MKNILVFIVLIVFFSCGRSNPIFFENMSKNPNSMNKQKLIPMNNLTYLNRYDENNYIPEYLDSSLNYYENNLNEIRFFSKDVTNYLSDKSNQSEIVKYKLDPISKSWIIDEDASIKNIKFLESSNRDINYQMGQDSKIPYKNAYEILKMKQNNIDPTENYIKQTQQTNNEALVQENIKNEYSYNKVDKSKIFSLSNIE